jgi:hypothetical protein
MAIAAGARRIMMCSLCGIELQGSLWSRCVRLTRMNVLLYSFCVNTIVVVILRNL